MSRYSNKFKSDRIEERPGARREEGKNNLGIGRKDFLTRRKKLLFSWGLILPRSWKKSLSVFVAGAIVLLLVFVSLPAVNRGIALRRQILGAATTGFDLLDRGHREILAQDFQSALEAVRKAESSLAEAQEKVGGGSGAFSVILKLLPQGQDVDRIFTAGLKVADALNNLILGVRNLEDIRLVWNADENASEREFYLRLGVIREQFVSSGEQLDLAVELLDGVNSDIVPEEFREEFLSASDKLLQVQLALQQITDFQGLLLGFLGGESKTYLLVFQNNNEMRATGGFIGTYGLLEFENGRMKINRIESIYAIDGQLKEQIAAPGPLQRQLTDLWALRDSNWFVDFPASSRKMLSFLEKETGILADGVIAMTPDLLEHLLVLTGPVEMSDYGETLTAQNFRVVVQYQTSIDYDREENRPKKFLSDFTPRFLEKLKGLQKEQWFEFFNVLSKAVEEKQLMFFSLDPSLQEEIRNFRASGEIIQTKGDYLAIFHSNVGGGKTDQGMRQKVSKRVIISREGAVTVNLSITRRHESFNEEFFPKNIDFMRILVPFGSELLDASGFDNFELLPAVYPGAETDPDLISWDASIKPRPELGVYVGSESGYTEFMGWVELDPGQTRRIELTYELPFLVTTNYSHVLQKQPGELPFEFSLRIDYPEEIVYTYPESSVVDVLGISFDEVVRGDSFYALIGSR